jgi:hypothetical protein
MLKIFSLKFLDSSDRSLKDMIDETSVLTLTSFSLDSQTGSRLAVILTAETTHNSYIFLFRYASQYNAQPFVSYEYVILLKETEFKKCYVSEEHCSIIVYFQNLHLWTFIKNMSLVV